MSDNVVFGLSRKVGKSGDRWFYHITLHICDNVLRYVLKSCAVVLYIQHLRMLCSNMSRNVWEDVLTCRVIIFSENRNMSYSILYRKGKMSGMSYVYRCRNPSWNILLRMSRIMSCRCRNTS